MHRMLPLLSLLLPSLFLPSPRAQADSASEPPALSQHVTEPAPWLSLKANSEQRQPVYMGLSPRDLVFGKPRLKHPILRDTLRTLAERQARYIAAYLKQADIEFEAWPVQEWQGRQTWAFARWRRPGERRWAWLSDALLKKPMPGDDPQPQLPHSLDPQNPKEAAQIFADFLELPDLYEKPSFAECIWTQKHDESVHSAWLDPDQGVAARKDPGRYRDLLCRAIGQPARFNEVPQTFSLLLSGQALRFPLTLHWQATTRPTVDLAAPTEILPALPLDWPADWRTRYAEEIEILSGTAAAEYPFNGKPVRTFFKNKNSADAANQLLEVVAYLEHKYKLLGLKTERESFVWRGIPQANLIAKIPGQNRAEALPPIVLADHFDTAFAEDRFAQSGGRRRESAPGADDNMAATVTLLQAARVLASGRLAREIWLYHLTGEEFPGDDLGARIATSGWLRRKQALGGIVLLDMIGYRKKNDRIFQINAGASEESERIAQLALRISKTHQKDLIPVVRTRFDPLSYLYNTDGLIFSDAGYPVVLFNEHINRRENLDRPHYHQSTDAPRTLDLDYATTVAMSAIQTVAALASAGR